ncbi:pentapeptide repeat-containing protein [Ktedonospora formicarum]
MCRADLRQAKLNKAELLAPDLQEANLSNASLYRINDMLPCESA